MSKKNLLMQTAAVAIAAGAALPGAALGGGASSMLPI